MPSERPAQRAGEQRPYTVTGLTGNVRGLPPLSVRQHEFGIPQHPQSEPAPRREFHISQKRDHAWFAGLSAVPPPPYEDRKEVSRMIDQNAHELFGDTISAWTDVQQHILATAQGTRYTGIPALTYSLSLSMAAVARRMGWSAHSPEFVYMSGCHYAFSIGRDLEDLNKRIQAAEEGKRQFVSEDARAQRVGSEKAEAGRLAGYRHSMKTTLDEYVQRYLPQGEQYLELLRFLPYASNPMIKKQDREKILNLFEGRDKPGNLEKAYAELKKHPTRQTS
jgi:hypothetical protein